MKESESFIDSTEELHLQTHRSRRWRMEHRPEWVHCVGHVHVDLKGTTWCGRLERPFFQDAAHAAENGRKGGRLVVCRECAAAITEALHNGHDDTEYPPKDEGERE